MLVNGCLKSPPDQRDQLFRLSQTDRKNFFEVVELAKKTDHQIYTKTKLNRFAFETGSNATSVFNIINSPIAIGKIIYLWGKSRCHHLSFDRAEALSHIASHLANFAHSIGQIVEYTYSLTKEMFGALLTRIAGIFFFAIELFYNSVMLQHNFSMEFSIDMSLISALKDYKNKGPRTKEEFIEDLKSLRAVVEANEKEIRSKFATNTYENFIFSTERTLKKLPSLSKYRIQELKSEQEEAVSAFCRSLIKKNFGTINSKYLKLTEKQVHDIDVFARNSLHKDPYPCALEATLNKVQESHMDQKTKLARILRPWITEKYSRENGEILNNLVSEDLDVRDEATTDGFDLLVKIKRTLLNKRCIHIASIVINAILLTSVIASLCAFPMLSPVLIAFLSFYWYLTDYAISNGLLDSEDGSFQFKNLIPAWVYKVGEYGAYLSEIIKESAKVFHEKVMTQASNLFRDRQIVDLGNQVNSNLVSP